MSNFYLMTRAAYEKLSRPVAKAALRAGFTPDSITIIGTAGTVVAALTLFPIGQLWWGAIAVWFFVLADMLDGAMARERGGGTRFGAVLDATCDRIGDGAVFCGLLWWAVFGLGSASLIVATLICLVTSQVISYIKARAEASGLSGEGGIIERPERLIIVLVGAGFSGLFGVPWLLHAAMWVLAVASLVTVGQRLHSVRTSPGAMEPLPRPESAKPGEKPETSGHSPRERGGGPPARRARGRAVTSTPAGPNSDRGSRFSLAGQVTDLGYAAGWLLVRAMPEILARNAFDAGAHLAARGGGPEQLRKNLARVLAVAPAQVPDRLIRASLASYARYWREAFRLPSMDLKKFGAPDRASAVE